MSNGTHWGDSEYKFVPNYDRNRVEGGTLDTTIKGRYIGHNHWTQLGPRGLLWCNAA